MKAVILAAGRGVRLGEDDHPKCLTVLETGETILGRQWECLKRHVPAKDVWVVVGYKKEMIMEAFPHFHYVHNDDYHKENTSKSLLKAIKNIDDTVLWINGDVVFHPSILELLLKKSMTSMIVNRSSVGEEEIKYTLSSDGTIQELSKTVKNGLGEAVGINFITKEDLPFLTKGLEACQPQDYFEKGVEFAIQRGLQVFPIEIAKDLCTEIDFPEDLKHANQLLKGFASF